MKLTSMAYTPAYQGQSQLSNIQDKNCNSKDKDSARKRFVNALLARPKKGKNLA